MSKSQALVWDVYSIRERICDLTGEGVELYRPAGSAMSGVIFICGEPLATVDGSTPSLSQMEGVLHFLEVARGLPGVGDKQAA